MTTIRIALDTSKHAFQVRGVDEGEMSVLRRHLRRSVQERRDQCGCYLRGNEPADHAACAGQNREKQTALRCSERAIDWMLINAIRGHAAEFGVTVAKGSRGLRFLSRGATVWGVRLVCTEMPSLHTARRWLMEPGE